MAILQVLILPGIGNSGPDHWQTRWEAANPAWRRVQQRDWDHPVREEWVAALDRAVATSGPRTVLVAHSLACLTIAHWAAHQPRRLRGALLVAPPDPLGPGFPQEALNFVPLPMTALPFPSVLVASTDDPYSTVEFAQGCADGWRSRFVCIGAAGHINSASNLGNWPAGEALLADLIAATAGAVGEI